MSEYSAQVLWSTVIRFIIFSNSFLYQFFPSKFLWITFFFHFSGLRLMFKSIQFNIGLLKVYQKSTFLGPYELLLFFFSNFILFPFYIHGFHLDCSGLHFLFFIFSGLCLMGKSIQFNINLKKVYQKAFLGPYELFLFFSQIALFFCYFIVFSVYFSHFNG